MGSINTRIGLLSMLTHLAIRQLQFNGSATLPTEICQLANLQELWLSENNLLGSLPTCVNNLSRLSVLCAFHIFFVNVFDLTHVSQQFVWQSPEQHYPASSRETGHAEKNVSVPVAPTD
jgi:hypothetical protein